MKQIVALIGTRSIQGYVFASNELKQNLGASELVREALDDWQTRPERIYVGGGNAALRFASMEAAREAIYRWSREWLRKAPGLEFAVGIGEAEGDSDDALREAYLCARRNLKAAEGRPEMGARLGALPFVAACPSTGWGASEVHPQEPGQPISAETEAKLGAVPRALRRLKQHTLELPHRLVFPTDFDELGAPEGRAQLTLVHVDGNGMGELLDLILEGKGGKGAALTERLVNFSRAVEALAQDALRRTVQDLAEAYEWLAKEGIIEREWKGEGSDVQYLPMRPIVHGGDDLVFVCAGRIGFAVLTRYLYYWEALSAGYMENGFGEPRALTAGGGLYIMPAKFPFSRGHEMAEHLCTSAKNARRAWKRAHSAGAEAGSWLDFQIVLEGLILPLRQLREHYYRSADGNRLWLRPYAASGEGTPTYEELLDRVHALRPHEDDRRAWPRSHSKALMEELAAGKTASEKFVRSVGSRGYGLPGPLWLEETNANGETSDAAGPGHVTPWFDAAEILDFYCEIPWGRYGEQEIGEEAMQDV